VQDLFALAESADRADVTDGVSLPEEIKRREDRLKVMAAAKAKIVARAAERHEREKALYEQKMATRADKQERTGKKPGGKSPKAPKPGPRASDQINLTDEESRVMPVAGGGFEQAYNAQAAVDATTMLVVGTGVTQAPNPDGHFKFPHLWPPKLLQAGRPNYRCLGWSGTGHLA